MPAIKRPKMPKRRKQASPEDAPIGSGLAKRAKDQIMSKKKKLKSQLDKI